MTDHFALLGETRRPWLEGDSLKQNFLSRSGEVHPDRVHGADEATKSQAQRHYTELNAAYLCLREPRERLRHLLELESGHPPRDLQEMPAELADLFMEISQVCRQADGFLAKYAGLTSPLLRAQSFAEIESHTQQLTARQGDLARRQERLLARLRELDRVWADSAARPAARTELLAELEIIARGLGFFSRWQGQVQERLLRLML